MAGVPVRNVLRARSFRIVNTTSSFVSPAGALSSSKITCRRNLLTASCTKNQTGWHIKFYHHQATKRYSQRAAYSTVSTTTPQTTETASDTMTDSEPTGLIAKKGIELLTFGMLSFYIDFSQLYLSALRRHRVFFALHSVPAKAGKLHNKCSLTCRDLLTMEQQARPMATRRPSCSKSSRRHTVSNTPGSPSTL